MTQGPRRQTGLHLSSLACLACLACATTAPAPLLAQAVGPRPIRLTDLTPTTVFHVETDFARLGSTNGLALPLGVDLRLTEEIAFLAELPFGYVGASGQVADPLIGNLALGARGSRYVALGRKSSMRLGAALRGRFPTAPALKNTRAAAEASVLRSVSFYRGERWSPGAGAVRADVGLAFDSPPFSAALEMGGVAVLPLDARPAHLGLHYGLLLSARALKRLWALVEFAGADAALGRPEDGGGHLLTLSLGVRMELGRFSPAVHVAFPLAGNLDGNRPIVFGFEMASF